MLDRRHSSISRHNSLHSSNQKRRTIMTMETHKITVSRGTFNLRDRGNQDGYPVIMLHGWPESSYCWEGVTSFWISICVSSPPIARPGRKRAYTGRQAYQKLELAKDIIEVIDSLGISDFYLVGHDWGGIVAQELAFLISRSGKEIRHNEYSHPDQCQGRR